MITEELLLALGVQNTKPAGTEIRGSCPQANDPTKHAKGDSRPSWSINVETGFSFCAGCAQGWSLRSLVQTLAADPSMVDTLLEAAKEGESRALSAKFMAEDAAPRAFTVSREEPGLPHARVLDIQVAVWADADSPYMESRGFDRAVCAKNLVGWDETRRRVTFPVYDEDVLVGVVGRAVDEGVQPKYWFYDRLKKGQCVYAPRWCRGPYHRESLLYVVEGPTDALRLAQKGYPWVVAPFGARVTKTQQRIISRMAVELDSRVVLLFDNDPAGRVATMQAGTALRGRVPGDECLVGRLPPRAKDPGKLRPVHSKRPFRTMPFLDWALGERD